MWGGKRMGKQTEMKCKKKSHPKRRGFALPLANLAFPFPNLAFPGSSTESSSPPRLKRERRIDTPPHAKNSRFNRAGGEKLFPLPAAGRDRAAAPAGKRPVAAPGFSEFVGGQRWSDVAPIPVAARLKTLSPSSRS